MNRLRHFHQMQPRLLYTALRLVMKCRLEKHERALAQAFSGEIKMKIRRRNDRETGGGGCISNGRI